MTTLPRPWPWPPRRRECFPKYPPKPAPFPPRPAPFPPFDDFRTRSSLRSMERKLDLLLSIMQDKKLITQKDIDEIRKISSGINFRYDWGRVWNNT